MKGSSFLNAPLTKWMMIGVIASSMFVSIADSKYLLSIYVDPHLWKYKQFWRLGVMAGHDYAIRRLAWSPHLSNVLLSASYDMTCRVWSDESDKPVGGAPLHIGGPTNGREMSRMNRHTEFVTGIDWCMFGAEGWAASTGWDERLCVFDVRGFMV
ncbi:peroxisomal targeting signal 2 receptor [Ascosphaera pollenicola]|nr:peroxisomal targeting signal 2 receptor [Ascosphaera pollenicola]